MVNNKYVEIVRKMYLAFNNRDLDEWSKYFNEKTLMYVPSVKEPLKGRSTFRANNEQFLKGIPDAKYDFTTIFGQDNLVCARGVMTGTNASTKSLHVPICIVLDFAGDAIREVHWFMDQQAFQG